MKWQLPNSECHKTILSRDIHGSPSPAILQTHLPKTVPTGCVEMRGDWNNRSRRPPFGLPTQSLLRAASKAVEKGRRLAMIALLAKASREMQAGASGRRRLRLTAISALQLDELAGVVAVGYSKYRPSLMGLPSRTGRVGERAVRSTTAVPQRRGHVWIAKPLLDRWLASTSSFRQMIAMSSRYIIHL